MLPVFLSLFLGSVLLSAGDTSNAPAPADETQESSPSEPSGIATVVEIKGIVKAFSKSTGEVRNLQQGDAIYLDETISSDVGSSMQMEVADESLFTISESTTIRMDLFDLDEEKQDGHLAASVTRGVFRFVSGKVAKVKPENVNIDVPSGTIGIRGTIVLGEIEGEKCLVSLEAEEGDKVQHRIVFSSQVDGQVQQVELTKPGFATVIEKRGMPPKPAFELSAENKARFNAQLPPPRYLPRDAEGRPKMNPNVRDPKKFPGPMKQGDDRRQNLGGPNPPNGPGGGPGFQGQNASRNQAQQQPFREAPKQRPFNPNSQGDNRKPSFEQPEGKNMRQNQTDQAGRKPGFMGRLMGQERGPQDNQNNRMRARDGSQNQNKPPQNPPPRNPQPGGKK